MFFSFSKSSTSLYGWRDILMSLRQSLIKPETMNAKNISKPDEQQEKEEILREMYELSEGNDYPVGNTLMSTY